MRVLVLRFLSSEAYLGPLTYQTSKLYRNAFTLPCPKQAYKQQKHASKRTVKSDVQINLRAHSDTK